MNLKKLRQYLERLLDVSVMSSDFFNILNRAVQTENNIAIAECSVKVYVLR